MEFTCEINLLSWLTFFKSSYRGYKHDSWLEYSATASCAALHFSVFINYTLATTDASLGPGVTPIMLVINIYISLETNFSPQAFIVIN